jgi:MoaA/NifB/PqqE/SkfB family radical SAM enzyme
MSVPCAYRLYLPKAWNEDCTRCRAEAISDEVGFQTKPELDLAQVVDLLAARPAIGAGGGRRRLRLGDGVFARALPRAACPT